MSQEPQVSSKGRQAPKVQLTLMQRVDLCFRWCVGLVMLVNFVIFWAAPIFIQGQVWKQGMNKYFRKVFAIFDENQTLRNFGKNYIYSKEVHVDFFALSFLLFFQATASVSALFYWQITYDTLPWWLITIHYFQWVGFGGRGMGGAYSFAHREGHHRNGTMYKPWIAKTVGNFWENCMGFWYGNVPYNFTTSHIYLHHRLNGGKGDSFYQFDLDRSSWSDFCFYLYRILIHMTGLSSVRAFKMLREDGNKIMEENYQCLLSGMIRYWLMVPACILFVLFKAGCSPASIGNFLFFVYLQPLLCMTTFLALINFAFHGFVEFEADGKHIPCVNSTVIVDGEDDFYGEDDHMAHHYYGHVNHRELTDHQKSQHAEWAKYKASCFKEMAIVELAVLMLLKEWKLIAKKHWVDHSKSLSVDAAAALLEERAKRKEMSYEEYEFGYLPAIKGRAQALVSQGVCTTIEQAYKHLAHYR